MYGQVGANGHFSTYFLILQFSLALFVIFTLILTLYLSKRWEISYLPTPNYDSNSTLPRITIVLPTWNEEKVIEAKLDDVERQDYPVELVEVIIIDSASTDDTVNIARKWISDHDLIEGDRYRIIIEDSRKGKSYSINKAFETAHPESEILMMSDVDCRLEKDAMKKIGRRFLNASIGAVTGRQILLNAGQNKKSAEEESYRDFFSSMRISESKYCSTPIFHGECSAYRRSAISGHKLVENSNADDSQMAVSAIRSGFRSIYDPDILFYEMAPPNGKASKIQKVRRAQGLIRHFWRNKDMIFNRKFGNFRKVMVVEFNLHIILPIAVFLGVISGLIHIATLLLENELNPGLLLSISTVDSVMLFSDAIVLALVTSGLMGLPLPGGRLSFTFLNYMLILLRAQILIIFGKSLHRWQQVPSVREALALHDAERFSEKKP